MTVTLTGEMQKRLDAHLDAVEAALAEAGRSREERRGVVDDLEAQVLDMLAARSAAPRMEDVEAVLAALDPPSAYGSGGARVIASEAAPVKAGRESDAAKVTTKRRNYMKPSVLVALIVCGTLLVMTPAISDYFSERHVLEFNLAFAQRTTPIPEGMSLHFDIVGMEGIRRFGFWLTGSVAIGFGIIGGFIAYARERRESR
jgi:hypothetical protein